MLPVDAGTFPGLWVPGHPALNPFLAGPCQIIAPRAPVPSSIRVPAGSSTLRGTETPMPCPITASPRVGALSPTVTGVLIPPSGPGVSGSPGIYAMQSSLHHSNQHRPRRPAEASPPTSLSPQGGVPHSRTSKRHKGVLSHEAEASVIVSRAPVTPAVDPNRPSRRLPMREPVSVTQSCRLWICLCGTGPRCYISCLGAAACSGLTLSQVRL